MLLSSKPQTIIYMNASTSKTTSVLSKKSSASTPLYILACVDGTNSAEWRPKNTLGGTQTANYSHVKQIDTQFKVGLGGLHVPYEDGPELNGSGTARKIAGITRSISTFIKAKQLQGAKFRSRVAEQQCSMDTPKHDYEIVLFGHSRGGVIVGEVANALKTLDVGVYFMGLFDAVDRSYSADGGASTNVLFTYHARRDPSAKRMSLTPSRWTFGNDYESSLNNYEQVFFQTSHGGIGGSPALDYDDLGVAGDASCAGRSKRMENRLASLEGVLSKNKGTWREYMPGFRQVETEAQILRSWTAKGTSVATGCVQQSQAAYHWMVGKARQHGLPL